MSSSVVHSSGGLAELQLLVPQRLGDPITYLMFMWRLLLLSQLEVHEDGVHVFPVGDTIDLRSVPTYQHRLLARRHKSTTGGAPGPKSCRERVDPAPLDLGGNHFA